MSGVDHANQPPANASWGLGNDGNTAQIPSVDYLQGFFHFPWITTIDPTVVCHICVRQTSSEEHWLSKDCYELTCE